MSAHAAPAQGPVVVAGSTVLVAGLGLSGMAAARALLAAGAVVRAIDDTAAATVVARGEELSGAGATVRLGGFDPTDLRGIDLVVASPGIPPSAPLLATAAAAGIPAWSEPELAWRLNGGHTRLVGVTGTNGKTTTTELVAACLAVPAAGNIGVPLVEVLAAPSPPPLVVAELSSFQLALAEQLRPDVAVLLNVADDHRDWHGSGEAYAAAKARVWQAQRRDDVAVVGMDPGALSTAAAHPPPGTVLHASAGPLDGPGACVRDGVLCWVDATGGAAAVIGVDDLGVGGPHNLANAAAAVAAAVAAGAQPAALVAPLRTYRPGAHRLETVASSAGVTWVDDSKATNPHAAAAALRSYPSVVWIAGGLDKGMAFEPLADELRGRVRAAITIGAAGPAIAAVARAAGVHVVEAGDLRAAVVAAAQLARRGDTVLLAPACASMDQFVDYADRGRAFRAAVAAVLGEPVETMEVARGR